MRIKFLALIFPLVGICSCTEPNISIKVDVDELDHINNHLPILLDGGYIGLVTEYQIYSDFTVLNIERLGTIKLPKDSEFILAEDSVGFQALIVEKGSSADGLKGGDTVQGKWVKMNLSQELMWNSSNSDFKGSDLQDSLLKFLEKNFPKNDTL